MEEILDDVLLFCGGGFVRRTAVCAVVDGVRPHLAARQPFL